VAIFGNATPPQTSPNNFTVCNAASPHRSMSGAESLFNAMQRAVLQPKICTVNQPLTKTADL
jgi:hypothetical protein